MVMCMSNYEEKILTMLRAARIRFEREKSFSDLRGGKFRYDFFIENYGGRKVIVEVQGEQHYEWVKHFHRSRIDFTHAQENDRRKISYALAKGYCIYVIPYWEIGTLRAANDIFQERYRAKDRWKNDDDWRAHKKQS